jgi:hypothetical protein
MLSGSDIDTAAGTAGVETETLRTWWDDDAEFIASMNRAKQERSNRLRAEVQALATEAVAALRELVASPDTPPALRLRAALAILGASDAMKPETVGSTSPEVVRNGLDRERVLEGLGV